MQVSLPSPRLHRLRKWHGLQSNMVKHSKIKPKAS